MKNKKFLASVLCVMMLFTNNGVSVLAETQTTASEFTINSEMLGGLVVTIPDEVTLSKKGDNFVGTGRVTAQGATDPINILRVYTDSTITYKNQYKTDITVDADVDFGDVFRTDFGVNCKAEWDAYELKDNMTAREKSGYDVTVTAPFSKVKYIGEYKTNILFNIELRESETFYLGFRLTSSSEVNTSNDNEEIDYTALTSAKVESEISSLRQTDTVAVLDGVDYSRRNLEKRGDRFFIEYPLNSDATEKYNLDMTMRDVVNLNIPSTILVEGAKYDVVGVSLDELFKEKKIRNLIRNVILPETIISIDAYNYEDYLDIPIICNTYREFVSINNNMERMSPYKLLFKTIDFFWADIVGDGVSEVAGGGDYSAFMKSFGELCDEHFSEEHGCHPELCRRGRVVKFKLPSKSSYRRVRGVEFQGGNTYLGILMQCDVANYDFYGNTTGCDYYLPKQIWVIPKTYEYFNGFASASPIKPSSNILPGYFFQPNYSYQANLKGVIFQDGYRGSIGTYAFQYCLNLDEVVIPASTSFIEKYAFGGDKQAVIKNLYIDYDGTTTVVGSLAGDIENIYFSGTREEWEASPYYGKVSSDHISYNVKYRY